MSSFTVKKLKYELQSYQIWMRKHSRIRHWGCLSNPTDYKNSHQSGLRIQNTANTGHSSQPTMSGPLSSMSWKFCGHSGTRLCGCQQVLSLLCITSSLSTMTLLILWMAWCELWPRRIHNGSKTYIFLWSLGGRGCPNIILKWLQRLVCYWFWHIPLILSRGCDCLRSGTSEWICILKMRLFILPDSRRPFWSMWRMNTVLNIDFYRVLNPQNIPNNNFVSSAMTSRSGQSSYDWYDLSSDDEEYLKPDNVTEMTPG